MKLREKRYAFIICSTGWFVESVVFSHNVGLKKSDHNNMLKINAYTQKCKLKYKCVENKVDSIIIK